MSFWTYCCKFAQVHRPFSETFQFPNPRASAGGDGLPQLEGCGHYSIDNEGDWKRLSDYAGIDMDNNLWCWIPSVVDLHAFKAGLDDFVGWSRGRKPVMISDDGDWDFVASNSSRGYAIKFDGRMFAFGENNFGDLGVSLIGQHDYNTFESQYRARLSTGIDSVGEVVYCPVTLKKATRWRISSVPVYMGIGNPYTQGDSGGSGAQLRIAWTGTARAGITSGGSGYTSKPTVVLKGVGSDEGKTLPASRIYMTETRVQSIDVENAGEGYTYAKAVILQSHTKAEAVIEDGKVVSWTITDQGKVVGIDSELFMSVIVIGDGFGATAGFTMQPRSVVDFYFSNEKMWTEDPVVEITGGGGSGASGIVYYIEGTVDKVEVLSPGSGYTQGEFTVLQVEVAEEDGEFFSLGAKVNLIPANVVSAEAVPGVNPIAAKAHSGAVVPFSAAQAYLSPLYPSVPHKPHLFTMEPGGTPLMLSAGAYSNDTFSLQGTVFGFKYPPFIRALWKADLPATYTHYNSELPYARQYYNVGGGIGDSCDPCNPVSRDFNNPCAGVNVRLYVYEYGGGGSWPTASGHSTKDFSYSCVDGSLWQESAGPPRLLYDGTECEEPFPVSTAVQLPYFTGPIWRQTVNLVDMSTTDVVSGLVISPWHPPTRSETVRLYFQPPPKYGGTPPSAYSEPTGNEDWKFGSASSVTFSDYGTGVYDHEPLIRSVGGVLFEEPIQITGQWKSVSVSGSMTLGVDYDGRLFWWGRGSANKSASCPFPSPVGQGAAMLFASNGLKGKTGLTGGPNRIDFDIPSHGARIAPSAPFMGDLSDPAGRGYTFSYTPFAKSSGFGKDVVYHPNPNSDCLFNTPYFWLFRWAGGAGYEQPPGVWQSQIGEPLATFSSRLFGPTMFEKVQDGLARGIDGTWYNVASLAAGGLPEIRRPIIENSYTYTFISAPGPCPQLGGVTNSGAFSVLNDTITRHPGAARVERGGSGYTSATITVSGVYASLGGTQTSGSVDSSDCVEYDCDPNDGRPPDKICNTFTWTYGFSLLEGRSDYQASVSATLGVVNPYTTVVFYY